MIFNLYFHVILPRVAAFCFTDEDDAIAVCVTDADVGWLDGLTLLQPGDLRPGFALQISSQGDMSFLHTDAANIN